MRETFDIKLDRYAHVDYYSEESSTNSSCDGDADDDSFVSASEKVRIDMRFLELNSTVDRTRHNFDRLMRVCSDDDSSIMSCDLLSVMTKNSSKEDDDLSYGSAIEKLPSLSSGSSTETFGSRCKYEQRDPSTSRASIKYSLSKEMLCEDFCPSPSLIEISTDTSTLCSNQDFSVRTHTSEKTVSACCDDIDNSIDLVRNMKRRIKSLKRFPSDLSTVHGSSDSIATHNSPKGTTEFNDDDISSHNLFSTCEQPQSSERKCDSISSSSVSPVMPQNERLIEIKSRLRNLENLKKKFPSQQGSLGDNYKHDRSNNTSTPVRDLVFPPNERQQRGQQVQDRPKDIRDLKASLRSIEGSRRALIESKGICSVATEPVGKYMPPYKNRQQPPKRCPSKNQEKSTSLKDPRYSLSLMEQGHRTSNEDVRNKMVMASHCNRQVSMSSQLSTYSEEFVVSSQISNPLYQLNAPKIMTNDKIAETILRISREIIFLIFVLAVLYIVYSCRRDMAMDAIRTQAYQMRLLEKALVFANQQKDIVGETVLQERRQGLLRQFFFGA